MAAGETEDLVLSISADVSQMQRAINRLVGESERSTRAIRKQFQDIGKGSDTALQARINQMVGVVSNGQREWTGALAQQGAAMDALRMRFSPLYAEVRRYRDTIGEIRRAHALGAISADEMASAISRERQAALSSIAALKGRASAAQAIGSAQRISAGETANLAAQLNDIGVQLAGGQSPFQIAIQQGAQINQVLGQRGARGAVTALAGAFGSLINPVSLATIAIIGLGGAAIQYFTSVLSEGDKSRERMKEEADLVQRVADQWGEALPAIKRYAEEQRRLQQDQEAKQAVKIVEEDVWGRVREAIGAASSELVDYQSLAVGSAMERQQQFEPVIKAWQDLNRKIKDTSATTGDMQRVFDEFTKYVNQTGLEANDNFADSFFELASAIAAASAKASQITNQLDEAYQKTAGSVAAAGQNFIAEQQRQANLSSEQLRLENEIARVRASAARAGAVLLGNQAEILAKQNIAAEDRRNKEDQANKGRQKSLSTAEREKQAADDFIASLREELRLIGATNEERAIAEALSRAGPGADKQRREEIEQLVPAIERAQTAFEQGQKASEFFFDTTGDAILSMVPKIETGNAALDQFLNTLIEASLQAAILGKGPLAGLLGGAGGLGGLGGGGARGGLLGGLIVPGILHSGGIAGRSGYGHGRSVSPAVFAGAPRYHGGGVAGMRMGLRPDEVPAILRKGEPVLPSMDALRQVARGGGGATTVVVNNTINAPNSDAVAVGKLQQQVSSLEASLPRQIVSVMAQQQGRGTV